jgi:hypothetical protein
MSVVLPPGELRALSAIMDRMLGLPDKDVRDRAAVVALEKRGLVALTINGWRANDEGARAYVATVCVEAGQANPFAAAVAVAS